MILKEQHFYLSSLSEGGKCCHATFLSLFLISMTGGLWLNHPRKQTGFVKCSFGSNHETVLQPIQKRQGELISSPENDTREEICPSVLLKHSPWISCSSCLCY